MALQGGRTAEFEDASEPDHAQAENTGQRLGVLPRRIDVENMDPLLLGGVNGVLSSALIASPQLKREQVVEGVTSTMRMVLEVSE